MSDLVVFIDVQVLRLDKQLRRKPQWNIRILAQGSEHVMAKLL